MDIKFQSRGNPTEQIDLTKEFTEYILSYSNDRNGPAGFEFLDRRILNEMGQVEGFRLFSGVGKVFTYSSAFREKDMYRKEDGTGYRIKSGALLLGRKRALEGLARRVRNKSSIQDGAIPNRSLDMITIALHTEGREEVENPYGQNLYAPTELIGSFNGYDLTHYGLRSSSES